MKLDSVGLAVMNSRLEGVVRAMLNTLLRSARTGVLAVAHDFSCCILTRDDELLCWAESLPIHVMSGPDLMAKSMKEFHPDFKRGDAFLHNSPYHGCSHAADWSILIPVFDDDDNHQFTIMAKAHQGDCGNAQPTTYAATARDVYEEGALIFPCVKAQTNYEHNWDLVRMCESRVRVPDQWWGDYLALLGAARTGERRLSELIKEVGVDVLHGYARDWLDYSEQAMAAAIAQLPAAEVVAETLHDPLPAVPEGVLIKVGLTVDPEQSRIVIDLCDNPDCLPSGINLSEACARTAAMLGVFTAIGRGIPANAGSFRCLDIRLRENCCVGIPRHPASCSAATGHLSDRVGNTVLRAMSELAVDQGVGMAEFGFPQPAALGVISGEDPRSGRPFINQLYLAVTAGPGGAVEDCWLTSLNIGSGGGTWMDSVEIAELKHPIRVKSQELMADTEGAGRRIGAPSARVEYGPVDCTMEVVTDSDGEQNVASGVNGGHAGAPSRGYRRGSDGELVRLASFHRIALGPDETVVSMCSGGGGYGAPWEREVERVAEDVAEEWITPERARTVYGVVFSDDGQPDAEKTAVLRESLRSSATQG